MDNRFKEFAEQLLAVRPTTRNLVTSILMDAWPNRATMADFGIESRRHYEALYHPIREAEIMPNALDAVLGDGERLTALIRQSSNNPYPEIAFRTSQDVALGRAGQDLAGRSLFQEILSGSQKSPVQETARMEQRVIERERG